MEAKQKLDIHVYIDLVEKYFDHIDGGVRGYLIQHTRNVLGDHYFKQILIKYVGGG